MRITRALIVFTLCAVIAGSGSAQETTLTLDDCIELALQKRWSIIRARSDAEIAKWDKVSALGALLPRISANYRASESKETERELEQLAGTEFDTLRWDATRNGNPITITTLDPTAFEKQTFQLDDQDRSSSSLSADLNWTPLNVPAWFDMASAGAAKARANLNVIESEQDLILSVKSAYYLYLAAFERVQVDEEAVKRSQEQLKLIESKYDLGSASKSDVLKQKVQFGNDRLALLEAQNAVTNTRADLAFTVGLDPNSEVDFSTEYIVREYDGTLEEAMSFGLQYKPSLLAAGKDVDAWRHAKRSRWSEYLPTGTFFLSYSISDGTQGDTTTFDFSSNSRTYGISLNWNIFDGFFRERNIAASKANLNAARAFEADERNRMASLIKSSYLEIERLKEQKMVSRDNVEAAQEDLKITQEKYNLGAATILDLLDAQVSLRQAQVSLIRADFDLNLAVARLENAMGKM